MITKGILILIFFLMSCTTNSNHADAELMSITKAVSREIVLADSNIYCKVHSLRTNDGTFIGDVYAKFINDTIFTDLYVISKMDTLYSIKKSVLSNVDGKDSEVAKDGFYGYKFILKEDDYVVLSYYSNNGINISDDITIEWNYGKHILEIQKVP